MLKALKKKLLKATKLKQRIVSASRAECDKCNEMEKGEKG